MQKIKLSVLNLQSQNQKYLTKIKNYLYKDHNVIKHIADFYLSSKSFSKHLLQEISSLIAVVPSIKCSLINRKNLTVADDGTCIHCHSSSLVNKACDYHKNGIYNCQYNRKYSDINATFGLDNNPGTWFYGHTLYSMSTYNPITKTDLPLLSRYTEVNRHDSILVLLH